MRKKIHSDPDRTQGMRNIKEKFLTGVVGGLATDMNIDEVFVVLYHIEVAQNK